MDLHLQDSNGLALMQRIRSNDRWNELPIVVVSGAQDEAVWQQAKLAGMSDRLPKPVEPDKLFRVLTKWLPPAEGQDTSGRWWTDTELLDIPHALHRLD